MTRLSIGTLGMTAALGATLLVAQTTPVSAQCATCPQPVVAFSPVMTTPVVTQPVVVQQQVVRTGWYPGAWIDRMRMRRWNSTTTVAAAPTFTTANFAPTATWVQPTITTVNRPVITAFAPMQPAVQTSFLPVISSMPVASPCISCPQQVTAAFAPVTTVLRPVEVTPVVQTVVAAPACSACSMESPCGGCSACSAGVVSQASFSEAAPVASDCPSCAASSSPVEYYGESTTASGAGAASPATPRPSLEGNVPTPADATYPGASSAQKPAESSGVDPKPEADDAEGPEADPEADPATDASTSFEFKAPPLIAPQNDRTANRPTVDVHNAVYSQPARQGRVSTTAAKVSTAKPAAPATDANGWYSVSER